jgi:hypothetical protein
VLEPLPPAIPADLFKNPLSECVAERGLFHLMCFIVTSTTADIFHG